MLLAPVLAAAIAYVPTGRQSTPNANAKAVQPQAPPHLVTYDRQVEVKDWPKEVITSSAEVCKSGDACEMRFVIATVPDPKNTPYQLGFDRLLEAIQLGASQSHYTLDKILASLGVGARSGGFRFRFA